MKVFGLVVMVVVTVAGTSEAFEPGAIIHLKNQVSRYLLNNAIAILQTKQNLIPVKQDFVLRQIPHLVAYKADNVNSFLQLKKNLLSTTAAHLGQIHIISGGGKESEESFEEVNEPYSPLAALPAAAPASSYGPLLAAPASSYRPPPAAPASLNGPPPAALASSNGPPLAALASSNGPPPAALASSNGPPPAALASSNGPPPAAPASSYGPPPAAPASSYGPPLAGPVQPTPSVNPAAAPPLPPSTCLTCDQSTSNPLQFTPYRPGAHVQPAPPPRPQGTYGLPSLPQGTYGPPLRLRRTYGPLAALPQPPPQSHSLPPNHKPAPTGLLHATDV